jgi:hypothetical protein
MGFVVLNELILVGEKHYMLLYYYTVILLLLLHETVKWY